MKNTVQAAIGKACAIFGSQLALAENLGVTPGVVSQWVKGARPVPPRHCPKIERLTDGVVRCEELCPDVDWGLIRNAAPINDHPYQCT